MEPYDVIVVGGGHNGLIAAAYLAKDGRRVLVLERRDLLGGAAVSEHPFGPDYTVSTLSYVLSLLPPELWHDLNLAEHGLFVYPQGPYFAPRRDGRYLQLPDDPARRAAAIEPFSKTDAEAYERWEAWLSRLGRLVGPLLHAIPPTLGSRRPRDLVDQAGLLARLRGVDVRAAVDLTRLFSASVADLVEDRFSSDAMRGLLSVSGVIGMWAGPRSAGTGFVTLHHHLDQTGGQAAAWGFPRGGMGAVTQALAAAARSFGAEIRTATEVARIDVRGGEVCGVTLHDGSALTARTVVATVHPRIAFLTLVGRDHLPEEFVTDIEAWRSRSGTVKVNLAVDRLPTFASHPGYDPEIHGGTIVLAESLDDMEGAFQDAAAGRPSAVPFADICIPSVFDKTLAPEGHHIVSMFTQWVPHTWAGKPMDEELEAHADRVVARMERVAPGFTDSILFRQVIGPYQMEHEYGLVGGNIFHGELSASQLFHTRPAAGYADYRSPIAGLYQAGSATHGGGGVTGIPGRNVVRQISKDLRRAERRSKLRQRLPIPTR
jgi:phytoene dehydrogenase-like protein